MKVGLVYFSSKSQEKMLKISQGLARGVEEQGHDADIINALKQSESRLSHYQYIIIGLEFPQLINIKPPQQFVQYLKNAGILSGKRSFAYILHRLLRPESALRNLMKIMESEGMFIKNSSILRDENTALGIGRSLIIQK